MQTITDCQLPIRWIIELPDSDQESALRAFDFTSILSRIEYKLPVFRKKLIVLGFRPFHAATGSNRYP